LPNSQFKENDANRHQCSQRCRRPGLTFDWLQPCGGGYQNTGKNNPKKDDINPHNPRIITPLQGRVTDSFSGWWHSLDFIHTEALARCSRTAFESETV
jgi:hypothetical protein